MRNFLYLLVFLALAGSSCQKVSKDKVSGMPLPEILVNEPQVREVVYSYEYPAYLEAEQTVSLTARTSGFLESISFTPGQAVKAGQILFVIEPTPYADEVSTAEANVKSAEAQLVYAKASYERMKEASQNKAVSEIDYIQAESSYHSALASLENAKAALNRAQINLAYCYVKAPFDGHITRNQVDKGNYVNGGAQPVTLATLYKDRSMFAYFNMAYGEFKNLPPLSSLNSSKDSMFFVTVTDAAHPGKSWEGRLDYMSPAVDLETGTVSVRAIVKNPQQELISGMYVQINVPYQKVPEALLIPEASIGTNQAGRFVYIVDKNNRIALRPVKAGALEADGMRQIISGVNKDDRYVVEALMSVRPGMEVKAVSSH